ncbi:MAG: SDR family oxidoreductase [Myxococcales bacterium]|nr:SDR family oxidoreductase [Myxococcales bacterium]
MDAAGPKALVTGGSGEIGRAICVALAEAGADVLFTFFSNHEGAEETAAAAVRATGREAIALRAHFGKEKSLDEVVGAAREKLGRVDWFVHNAASGVIRPAVEVSMRHWDWTHHINARAFFFLVQGLLKGEALMGRGGRILALSSLGASRAIPQYAAVGTSKAALESAVRHLAIELGPLGITANVVAPGVIDTWSLQQFANHDQLIEIAKLRTPTGRLCEAGDVAALVKFLCSPGAAMIHGQTIAVDGGYSILG